MSISSSTALIPYTKPLTSMEFIKSEAEKRLSYKITKKETLCPIVASSQSSNEQDYNTFISEQDYNTFISEQFDNALTKKDIISAQFYNALIEERKNQNPSSFILRQFDKNGNAIFSSITAISFPRNKRG